MVSSLGPRAHIPSNVDLLAGGPRKTRFLRRYILECPEFTALKGRL